MWATIPSRSRAGRSGWGSSGSRCSSTASTTCGSPSTTTCASCDSSHDDARATGLGRTEPRRAFLRPPTEWAGPAALADRATGLGRTEPRRAFLRPPTECAGPAAPVTMKIPYKWLQEFVDLRLSPAEAADRLTNAGIEVAAVTPLAPDVRGVVVGEIEAIERELGESHGHRLLLCRVSTGSQKFSVVLGVARELAALTGARLRAPKIVLKEAGPPARTLVRVRIEAPDLCHRFTARAITGVTVGPSPAWLQARLRAVGLRPISNVVDVTNYVLWELGHPLHAFDSDTVTDAMIAVRRGRAGGRGGAPRGARGGCWRARRGGPLPAAPPARADQPADGARRARARGGPAAGEGAGDPRRPPAPDAAEGEGPRGRRAELPARSRAGGRSRRGADPRVGL